MMYTTDDKFKRFVAMTDHPERFSDEELMELARDPEMAAWYQMLSDVEEAAKSKAHTTKVHGSSYHTLIISLLATAAAILIAFLLWPESHEASIMQPELQSVIVKDSPPALPGLTPNPSPKGEGNC